MQTTTRTWLGLLFGILAMLTVSLAAAETVDDYILGPGDEIAVTVFEHPELSLTRVVIRPDGLITHPFLGAIKVAGQTPTQLAGRLTQELKKELRAPLVTVSVLQMAGGMVYVRGEVTAPGAFPTLTPLTVARAINLALGLTPKASRREAYIIGPQGDTRKVDLTVAMGERAAEFMLVPSETLVVPPVEVKAITIVGEVGKPGKYGLTAPDDTLLDALLGCGWVTPSADRQYALLVRDGDEAQRVTIAPLLQYQPGAVGPHLESGDMLVFPRAINYVTVWGAVVKPGKIMLGLDEEKVSDLMVAAGGFTDSANRETASLVRANGESVTVDLKQALETPLAEANLAVQAGDTLLVASRRNEVTLVGAVGNPGSYPFTDDEKLLDLLTQGGGIARNGDLDNVALLRAGEPPVTVSVRGLFESGDMTNNLALRVGDTVVVPEVKRELYVFGWVLTPGKFEFEEGDRLIDIMARVGYDKASAAPWKTALIRRKGVDVDVYVVDMEKIIRGQAPDKNYLIENGDVIIVPKRTGMNWREWVQQLFFVVGAVRIFQ